MKVFKRKTRKKSTKNKRKINEKVLNERKINEINEKDIINSTHKYLLQNKNKNISPINLENSIKETNLMFQYFLDEIEYKELIGDPNYLSN